MAASDPDWAARLLADAERIASSITRGSAKAPVLRSVAQAVADSDPGRAERIASSITDESAKASALISIAQAVAAGDPDRAARLLADAERAANSITSEYSKALALISVVEALATTAAHVGSNVGGIDMSRQVLR